MKNAVIVMQEENWGDDGGDHDPALVSLGDDDFDFIEALADEDADTEATVIDSATADQVRDILEAAPRPALPCEIHGVFNLWHSYGG